MPKASCVRCGNYQFEMREAAAILNTHQKWRFVQCTACGGVAGVLDFHNVGSAVDRIEHQLERVAKVLKIRA